MMVDGLLSLIFFIIEFGFLVLILIKNRNHPQFIWIILLMIFLQLYQLMEFLMCVGLEQNIIGRIGLVTITFLPPLGVMLTSYVTSTKHWVNWSGITIAIALSIYYSIIPDAFTNLDCNPFRATYDYPLAKLYGTFYFGYIGWAFVLLSIGWIRDKKSQQSCLNKNALFVLIGYLAFLVPMALTLLIDPSQIEGLESIMCKYAILLATTLFIFSFQHKKKGK